MPGKLEVHQVELMESDVFNRGRLRADVDHLHRAKHRETADESIQPRSDIDMALRAGFVNPARHLLVLMKVGAESP